MSHQEQIEKLTEKEKIMEKFDERFKGWILQDPSESYRNFETIKHFFSTNMFSKEYVLENFVSKEELRKWAESGIKKKKYVKPNGDVVFHVQNTRYTVAMKDLLTKLNIK